MQSNGDMRVTADGTCVALVDGRCSIYENRPAACRVFAIGSESCNRFRSIRAFPPVPLDVMSYTLSENQRSMDERERDRAAEDTDRRAKLQQLDAATATPDAWGNLTAAQRSEAQRVNIRLTLALARRLLP